MLDDLFADMKNMPVGKSKAPVDPVSIEPIKETVKIKARCVAGEPSRFRPGMKPAPYKCVVRSDITNRFIKDPVNWESVINRKTYDSLTGKIIEDLDLYPDVLCGNSGEMRENHDIYPTIPDEVLTRKLPKGVDHIKTVFEYGVLTYPKNPNKKK